MVQRSPQFSTQIRGQRRESEPSASVFRPDLRREIEHAGDADAYPRLFLAGHRLPECRISEPLALLREAGCEERYDPLGDQRTPERVAERGEVERLRGQLSCRGGIGSTEDLGCLERRLDRDVIAWFCALDELGSHLYRERAVCQQHVRRLPVDCTSDRRQQTAANCLPDDVVPERQPTTVVSENVGLNELVDGVDQLRERHIGHRGQVVNAEPASEPGRECGERETGPAPVQIIKTDKHGILERGLLDEGTARPGGARTRTPMKRGRH